VAVASLLHYRTYTPSSLKEAMHGQGLVVRR